MNIFICDDSKEQRESLTKTIQEILTNKAIEGEIKLATNSAYKILDYIKENDASGVYFLDIELGQNINGIELAKKVNEIDKNAIIVMITSYSGMSELIFKYHIGAIDYIVKDNIVGIYKRVEECLIFIDDKLRQMPDHKCIIIDNNQSLHKLKCDDIVFLETVKKRTIALHTNNSYIEFKGTLKEMEDLLDKRFIRCHKSFIVNKDKISSIDKKQRILFMKNGSKCFVSMLLINKIIRSIICNEIVINN